MSASQSVLTRRISAATGSLLIAAGVALGLVGVLMLAFGPPTGWPRIADALATRAADLAGITEVVVLSEVRPSETESAAVVPTPVVPTSVAIGPDRTAPPESTASVAAPSATPLQLPATPSLPVANAPTRPPPFLPITRIQIPRIGLEADAAPAQLVERGGGMTWELPAFRAGHAEATAGAGGLGNAVLLGHVSSRSAGDVFRNLGKARVGDRVRVLSDADAFEYRVVEARTVPRTDVSILRPTRTASLTLITCTGTWVPLLRDYTQRLVVRAELVGSAAPSPIFEEGFADNGRGWPSDPRSTAWLADGGYRLFAREPSRFVAIGSPIGQPLRDVVVTGIFRKVGGPPGGGYGLIVRDQGSGPRDGISQHGRYYVLEVGDRGEVGIWRREDDHWEDLLPWTPSDAVRPGAAPNALTVRAIGPRLTFLVNGVQVASLEDSALAEGDVGVFLGGDSNEALLEWLAVQAPSP